MCILRQFLHNNGSLDQLPQHALYQLISCGPRRPSQLWQTRSRSYFFVGGFNAPTKKGGFVGVQDATHSPIWTAESMKSLSTFSRVGGQPSNPPGEKLAPGELPRSFKGPLSCRRQHLRKDGPAKGFAEAIARKLCRECGQRGCSGIIIEGGQQFDGNSLPALQSTEMSADESAHPSP